MSIHAHVSTASRDCDGDYSSGHTAEPTHGEQTHQFSELVFKERVLVSVMSVYSLGGTLTVTPAGADWHEQTEEGYRSASLVWCEDDCLPDSPWQRDHRAEAMGY